LIIDRLLNIINRLLDTFKEYNSPSCGFASNIIDCLLKIVYDEEYGLIDTDWV
jgi:hypothetical protein